MNRLEADLERCVGSGACEALAPDLFEVGDEGTVTVLRPRPEGAELRDAEEAVRQCPTRALRLVAEQPAPAAG
ncbi:ferredoxin [Blastococcus sp. MG754426]|uniref:ferredoxin n=1 Tax=unclassified Blastococcus TaxID=2619396 RepID=UPI001EEF9B9F|nr:MULTISPECIES: ferredoxin [unclassified Blastococcus]MCF6506037.1 ferredoxin [Blastococcus sp. MG754426]MCF6510577.1 ferredoxin [Blastococcus sp. MG754427]MCF6735610.1 ferredoxin [Blastococcus sp. KM273129]